MLLKDKDILSETTTELKTQEKKPHIDSKHMRSAWGDAFDYYIRGITEKYLQFRGRATRLEFWGFMMVAFFILLPIDMLGSYAEIEMLAYYYMMATAMPMLAVTARRLHDLNKNAVFYIGMGVVALLSALFIGYWAIVLVALWGIYMIKILSKPTDNTESIYGGVETNDEIYGDDNILIIKKFRMLALAFILIWFAFSYISFDKWSTQAEYMTTNDLILEKLEQEAKNVGLDGQQTSQAREMMERNLKSWAGKEIMPEVIDKAIYDIVAAIKQDSAKNN